MTALLATTAAVAAESLLAVEDEKVTPGVLGFLVVAALAVATWFLIRSMRRHLGRVDFVEEPAPTKGSGPTEDTRPGPTDGSDAGPTDAAPTR